VGQDTGMVFAVNGISLHCVFCVTILLED